MTNLERIKEMNAEELADFFFESPEIEFDVCNCCKYFNGWSTPEPCGTEHGYCHIPAKNDAFKKWLQKEAKR